MVRHCVQVPGWLLPRISVCTFVPVGSSASVSTVNAVSWRPRLLPGEVYTAWEAPRTDGVRALLFSTVIPSGREATLPRSASGPDRSMRQLS